MQLTIRNYLFAMLGVWLGCEALIVGFNLSVDPLGISPIRIIDAHLNALKPLRNSNDALVKRYDVDRLQPRTIFIGSSRIKQSIDPSLLDGTIYGPAYNAGVDGQGDPASTDLLNHYFRTDPNFRHVFIEIFATAAIPAPIGAGPVDDDGLLKRLGDWTMLLNSFGGLSYSWKTVAHNIGIRRIDDDKGESRSDGFAPFHYPGGSHFSVYNVPNFLTYTNMIAAGQKLSPALLPALTRLIDSCKIHRVECSFIITPLHADVLYEAYLKGQWPEFEKLKRTLASIAPTWDFTRYNPLIDERDGKVVYWPEAFHFSSELGTAMLRRITGHNAETLPPNFGILVDLRHVDDQLAAWRNERDAWIAENGKVVAHYQAAEANLRKGIPFSEATQTSFSAYVRQPDY